MSRAVIEAFEHEYASVRRGCELAIEQLDASELRIAPDAETNSVAIMMKHIAGNLRSRFTHFLEEDGEKPWRRRDGEFVDDFPDGEEGRRAILGAWSAGWQVLGEALASLGDADLPRIVRIRGEPHTVARALARSLAHIAYHHGQIVLVARSLVGPSRWRTLSIPRGRSDEFNRAMGFDAGQSTTSSIEWKSATIERDSTE